MYKIVNIPEYDSGRHRPLDLFDIQVTPATAIMSLWIWSFIWCMLFFMVKDYSRWTYRFITTEPVYDSDDDQDDQDHIHDQDPGHDQDKEENDPGESDEDSDSDDGFKEVIELVVEDEDPVVIAKTESVMQSLYSGVSNISQNVLRRCQGLFSIVEVKETESFESDVYFEVVSLKSESSLQETVLTDIYGYKD